MTPSVVIRPEAEADLAEAFAWYEERRAGLGDRFLLSVEATLSAIKRYPESFPVVHRQVRRALLRRFPYGVFYTVAESAIVVFAVFHCGRAPRRWQERG
jgi:plasmid stabilization system protein ParE